MSSPGPEHLEHLEEQSTFADQSTLQPPPPSYDDASTLASEPLDDAPISHEDVAPFEIGDTEDDEEMGENNHSLPAPEELKVEASATAGCGKMMAWMFLIFALLIAMTVGLSVGLTKDSSGSSPLQNWKGFNPVTRENVRQSMKSYIIENGVSSDNDFISSSSPQSKALDFLATKDPLRLNTPTTGLDSDEGYAFITRYIMSVFHASTGGDKWNYDLLFNTKHETCQWYDVFQPPVGQVGVLCNQNTKKIVGLSFISNQLDGTLPSELGVLTTLTYFESIGNNIMGKFPDRLQGLTNLKTAVFAYNQLTGAIPSWIDKWANLEFLYLSNNLLTGSVPSQMKSLQQLTVVAMDDNSLTGSVDFAWDLPRLEYLYLEDNGFVGRLPEAITTSSPLLINLDVSGNKLAGNLPSDLFKLSHLEILDINGNTFNGEIPSDIPTNNQKFTFAALQENLLSSTIPTQLGLLTKLQHLDLSGNSLVGDIPNDLTNLSELTYLFLAENEFNEGPIPTFVYTYNNLKELSLKSTKRTGSISELIATLSDLILLDLDDNQLTGPIPSEIGTLDNLQFLLLNRNQLSQAVPSEMGNLNNIRFLLLDNNSLTGSVEALCGKPSLGVAIADCDEVACTCCNPCCTDGVEDCHDNDLVSNVDPIWERGYSRQFFDFSNSSGYFIARPDN